MKIEEAIAHARETKKRNFVQSFDLAINIRNIDLKKPENKISKEIVLPHGTGKEPSICIISDSIEGAVGKDFILSLENDKKRAKIFAKKYDFFFCEPSLMPLVGRILGRYLGPKGKMPKLLEKRTIEDVKKAIRIRIKDSPVIHCSVGNEKMKDEEIKENIDTVINEVKRALPPKAQIKNAYLKLTMGKAVKIDIR